MSDQDKEPAAPNSIPKYLAEGLPKQDQETLEDIRTYIVQLIEYRERPIEPDLPNDTEIVEDDPKGKGAVAAEYRTCGDDSCQCMSGGEKHGPYEYRVYREGDTVKKEYLGKA